MDVAKWDFSMDFEHCALLCRCNAHHSGSKPKENVSFVFPVNLNDETQMLQNETFWWFLNTVHYYVRFK